MDDVVHPPRRRPVQTQRLYWIPIIVDLTLALLLGVAVFFLYPRFLPSSRIFHYLSHSSEILKNTYKSFTPPCRLHKDGGLPHAGCIRLVRISQCPDGGQLLWPEVFPIASAPSYRALSYTWGQATGKPGPYSSLSSFEFYKGMLVPFNLLSVLDRLARLNLEDGIKSGWYWIDYICIAQDNLRERGEQVGNMHNIYQQAEGVDIWLGPAAENEASEVSDVLRYVVSYADSPSRANRARNRRSQELLPESDWEILASFFSRRWFHRLWTLQEFALARNVRIILGDDYINSTLLWHAATFLYSRGFPLPLPYGQNRSAGHAIVQHSLLRDCVEDTDKLHSLLSKFAAREDQVPDFETVLVWVFWRSVATFATDARDYIYGILGIAETIMDRLRQTVCHDQATQGHLVSRCTPAYTSIKPDYSLDTARVFRDFIIRLMHSSIGIRAITLIQGGEDICERDYVLGIQRHARPTWIDREGTLPSWIPNLADKDKLPLSSYVMPSVTIGELDNYALLKQHSSYSIFGPSSNLSSTQRFHISESDLHVFGRHVGVVKRTSNSLPYEAQLLPCAEFALGTFIHLAEAPPGHIVAGNFEPDFNVLESVLHTLGLGSWKSTATTRNSSRENHITSLDAQRMETFYAGAISFAVCVKMEEDSHLGKPPHLGAVLDEFKVANFAQLPGISADFLEAQIAKWRAPEMTFVWNNSLACIGHAGIVEDVSESERICSTLVNEFPWARGRSTASITLDSQLAKSLYPAEYRQGSQESNFILLGLGPSKMTPGDEIWALQGSEWPFVLRHRHREDDDERSTGSKPRGMRSRWWWPWNSDVANRSQPVVYELLGDTYVHGLMNGELGAEITRNLEEIVIS